MNLTKEVKDLCNENYKTLKKKLKKTLEDGKTSHVHGLEE
jgi:mRNA-degrading endonuclease RelE of RelBE toxin-antitoxin system